MQPDNAGVRFPPPFIYLAAYLAGTAAERLLSTHLTAPLALRVLGGILGAGGLLLAGSAAMLFRAAGTHLEPFAPTTVIVTVGPYRFTRNPIYLGLAALYAGVALWRSQWCALALLPVVLWIVDRLVIAREERYLAGKFGHAYIRYRDRVRRWL